jgi:hypothetical protein
MSNPPSLLTNSKTKPRRNLAKRFNSNRVGLDETIVDERNLTRPATSEELFEENGLYKCQSENCKDKKELLKELMPQQKGAAIGDILADAITTLGPGEASSGYIPSRSRIPAFLPCQ